MVHFNHHKYNLQKKKTIITIEKYDSYWQLFVFKQFEPNDMPVQLQTDTRFCNEVQIKPKATMQPSPAGCLVGRWDWVTPMAKVYSYKPIQTF